MTDIDQQHLCPNCKAPYVFESLTPKGGKLCCPACGAPIASETDTFNVPHSSDPEIDEHESPPVAPSSPNLSSSGTLIGQVIGGCTIKKRIGQGGMGTVYLAHHLALDIPVAVKILRPDFAQNNQDSIKRFAREAHSAALLDHQNVVRVYNAGEDKQKGVHFIIMHFVDGPSMQSLLDERGTMPIEEALPIMMQACEALEYARVNNIVHRDIKPDNILIDKHGVIKLTDLGLAKILEGDKVNNQSLATVGTPYYMAPEQASGEGRIDHRADIYALGCTFYRMVCGNVPYRGSSIYKIINLHVNEPVPDPRATNPALPETFGKIIRRMMAKNPKDRYQSAKEVLDDIKAFDDALHGRRVAAKPQEDPPPDLTGTRILILEDSRALRSMLTRALKEGHAEVIPAEHGKDGLRKLNEAKSKGETIDLVITDIMMPEMNGFEFLKNLRAHPDFQGLPAVVFSTEGETKTILECVNHGISGYLPKPCPKRRILEVAQRVIYLNAVQGPGGDPEGLTLKQVRRLHELVEQAARVAVEDGFSAVDEYQDDPVYAIVYDFLKKSCPRSLDAE